jgi:hypothetical protein
MARKNYYRHEVNFVAVAVKLKPFRHAVTKEVFVVNEIKSENGEVVGKEEYPLNSRDGQEFVAAVITEVLNKERSPRKDEVRDSVQMARSYAKTRPPRLPETPEAIRRDLERSELLNQVLRELEFSLDERGNIVVRFVDDDTGPDFPLKHPVVQSCLHGIIQNGGSTGSPEEMNNLLYECVREATRRYRSRPKADSDSDMLEENSLLHAAVKLMSRLYHKEKKSEQKDTPTNLRADLVSEVKGEFPGADSEWPRNAQFTKVLTGRLKGPLQLYGGKAEKGQRIGLQRSIVLKVIDAAKLPEYVENAGGEASQPGDTVPGQPTMPPTQEPPQDIDQGQSSSDAGDAKNGPVASPPSDAGDAENAPAASRASDAGDAQNTPPASQPSDAHDAETAPQASPAKKKGKHLKERRSSPQEEGDKALDEAPEQEPKP